MNIYAPNFYDESFIRSAFLKTVEGRQNVLIGGDFNFCLDPILDKSAKTVTRAVKITIFYERVKLIDVWKQSHPTTKDYSFYSKVYDSYTKIDLFLMSAQLKIRGIGTEYLARLLDCVSLTLTIMMPEKQDGAC